ncbi:O-antigen ligase family protein [Vibrio lamellibrachiae]|uniref:O-antigen ligase family protein n=1 Tax=Vibrio lamellibrachiae TaxID=2910253 RepID=UPI003D0C0689
MNTKNNMLYLSLFLVPALLLVTNNYSVGVIVITLLLSFIGLKKDGITKLNTFDYVIVSVFVSYFLGAIPVAISDGSTLRYFQGGGRLLLCLPIYIFFRQNIALDKEKALNMMRYGAFIGSIGTFIFAIYQHFFLEMPRVGGYLFSINFGYLACSLTIICFGLAHKSNLKVALYLAAVAAFIATLLTLTRGAILAAPLLLIFSAIIDRKQISFKKIVLFLVGLILSSAAAMNLSSGIKNRVNFTLYEVSQIVQGDISKAYSAGVRIELWDAAAHAFSEAPMTGLPYYQRENLNQKLFEKGVVSKWVTTVGRGHAHSQYFEMIASNGVWGLLSITFIFIVPLVIFIKHFLKTGSTFGYSGSLFVAGFMIFGITEAPLQANLIGSFYGFMLAVFLAFIRHEKYPVSTNSDNP